MPGEGEHVLKHLVIAGRARSESFTHPRRMVSEPGLPPRERPMHAAKLAQQFDTIRREAETRNEKRTAAGLATDVGLVIEFASEPGYDLAKKSLDRRASGIQLLNLRSKDVILSGEVRSKRQEIATVRVPFGKLALFENMIQRYRSAAPASPKARHQTFLDPIAEIRSAALDAFWTERAPLPPPGRTVAWEAWLHTGPKGDERAAVSTRFRAAAQAAEIDLHRLSISLPETTVVLIRATRKQIQGSIELLDCLSELRAPAETADFFDVMDATEQHEWVNDAAGRLSPPAPDANAVCLLDTGVNHEHPLLAPLVPSNGLHAWIPAWGTHDDWNGGTGHGTQMAGLAAYGDLVPHIAGAQPIRATHWVESVKALKHNQPQNQELWGDITRESVSRIEVAAPTRKRVFSQQIAAQNTADRGRPTSWSSVMDQLCSGYSEDPVTQRLVFLSAGNANPPNADEYPAHNETAEIHDPGQAWNVITVGAYTQKDLLRDPQLPGWTAVAGRGDLAPSSSTSLVWNHDWPLKPDIVMEGGNKAVEPTSGNLFRHPSLEVLTTNAQWRDRALTTVDGTSSATAQAARLGALLQREYPEFWPETLRALLVHSAEWHPEMLGHRDYWDVNKSEIRAILRKFGFGVPDAVRASRSARSAVTLVVQDELKPFIKDDGSVKTDEMRLHDLPWPRKVLEDLGAATVEMTITLSYFIEPNPGPKITSDRYRYGSCHLRFDVARPTESAEEFLARVNAESRDDEYDGGSASDSANWVIGSDLRNRGSIHRDTWRGSAADLASKGLIAVYPVSGWWRLRPHLQRYNSRMRYSLIVSIRSPEQAVDLYAPIAVQIGVPIVISTP